MTRSGHTAGPSVTVHLHPTTSAQPQTVSITTTITHQSIPKASAINSNSSENTLTNMVTVKHEFSDPPEYSELEYDIQAPSPPSKPEPTLRLLRKCNIRSESSGAFLDCYGGGDHEPAVVAIDDRTYPHNKNQIWEILTVPDTNVVVIRSCANGCFVSAGGHGQHLRCEVMDHGDEAAQWLVEGVAWHKLRDVSVVRFRNVKYENCMIDESGGRGHMTEFISFDANGGRNQAFQLWER